MQTPFQELDKKYLKLKKELQQHLVELYQSYCLTMWPFPLIIQDNDVNISDVYVSPSMVVEQKDDKDMNKLEEFASDDTGLTHMTTNKVFGKSSHLNPLRHINRYQDIFCSRDGKHKRIYIIGDVCTGKSAFCKMMMQNWCRAVTGKSGNRESRKMGNENVGPDNDDNTRDISAFELLFHVPLRLMSGSSDDIVEMIKMQFVDYSKLIDKIFADDSECCLILADGLDEWTPPKRTNTTRSSFVACGLPTSHLVRSATIITTSRPTARGILEMKSSECDLKVNLLGVSELQTMIEKYREILFKSLSPTYEHYQHRLWNLQKCIWIYYNGHAIRESITSIYTNIVDILFSWMREEGEVKLALCDFRNTCTSIGRLPLPKEFQRYNRCEENWDLTMLLGKVAYEILIAEDLSSAVLDRCRLKRLGLTDEDISAVVQTGILHDVKNVDPTKEKLQLSFVHTSYLEFFAAVYISSYCLLQTQTFQKTLIHDLILRNISVVELLRLENVLIMVCGLLPYLTVGIVECIHQVAHTDKKSLEYRREINSGYLMSFHDCLVPTQIQHACFRCVSEIKSDNQQLRVTLCDCIVRTKEQLKMLLSYVEPVSVITLQFELWPLSHCDYTSLLSFLSQSRSLESINLFKNTCGNAGCNGHIIDISHNEQLQSLRLEDCNKISVSGITPTTNLKSFKMIDCRLSHEQFTSLSSFLSKTVSLERLYLYMYICKEAGCDGHSIDLSYHEQLQSLQLECCNNIYVYGDTSATYLKVCSIRYCMLSHGQCTSLSTFLSNTVSLERLDLSMNKCERTGCNGHSIDLTHHEQLQSLHLESCNQISISGVTPSTNLKSCEIIDCKLSHKHCTSLSSFLSQTVTLESLFLSMNTCEEAGCDGHSIDLSCYEQLQSLKLEGCYQISVSGVTPSTHLKSCEIRNCRLSHEKCTSLLSFLSQAVSLESLHFSMNTCKTARCDGHSIDLSHHEQLQSLQLECCDHISVPGVTFATNLKACRIRYSSLSHEQYTALSSFLLQTVSLESLDLSMNICEETRCDGHSIDLSHHGQLQSIQLEDCNYIYVPCVTSASYLKACRIKYCRLSHELCTSLSSFLSHAESLESLYLSKNTCEKNGCDGHTIDLSHHGQLQSLQLERCFQIYVSGVTTVNLKSCKIVDCYFSHKQCTSFVLFLSHSEKLESLYLSKNTCEENGCDGHSIDLSHHKQLQSLQLQSCNQISISCITPPTNLRSCEIIDCKLSHEQCTSLSSFLSQTIALESLFLSINTCEEAGCDGHSIDLSHHEQLRSLQLEGCDQISVSGISPSTHLKSCEIRNCRFTHEQCTALLLFLSQAVSLQSLYFSMNTCKEAGCDGHSIDLSHHEQLHNLQLEGCDQIYVSGVTPSTHLTSCEIRNCRLLHEQCTSFVSFLSQTVSLERLYLSMKTKKQK